MATSDFNPYTPPEAEIGGEIETTPRGPAWLTILFRPRATIRRILDSGRTRAALPLTVVCILTAVVPGAYERSIGKSPQFLRLMLDDMLPATAAAIFVFHYLLGYLIGLTGRWIGGIAWAKEVRTATAWSLVLLVPHGLVSLAAFAFSGVSAKAAASAIMTLDQAILQFSLATVRLIIVVWTIILWAKCVGEAHRFSALKAIGAGMLALLIYSVGFLAIAGGGMLVSYLLSK